MENVKDRTEKTMHTNAENQAPQKGNKRFIIVLGALLAVGATFGISKYVHSLHHEETEDAQIDASISPVIPRVSGYVSEVRVNDNQEVKKGDTLFILDDRDLRIKLEMAEAALVAAEGGLRVAQATTGASQANVVSSQANVSTIEAQIETAKINAWRANQDYERYANLIKDHSITQQQYEQALAQKQTAERQLQVLQQQKNAASGQSTAAASQSNATTGQVGVANATVKQRMADVENARLNLSYTVVTAPENGRISKVNVQPGQFVQAGQTAFSIVPDKALWVVANFKETQLDKMKTGQKVTVHVDAFPDKDFDAKLTSFAPATGARFALLPPDNASGNFVKVVQRIPVKIEFTNPQDKDLQQLRPGMNVNVDVHLD